MTTRTTCSLHAPYLLSPLKQMIASYLTQVLEARKRSMFKLLRSVVPGCMPKRNTEQTALDDSGNLTNYLLQVWTLASGNMRGRKGRKNQSETCQQKEANKTNSDYPLFTSYLLTPLKQKMIATTYLLMQSRKKIK